MTAYTFHILPEQRKAFSRTVGEFFGQEARYTMPGFRYVVEGKAEILRDGELVPDARVTDSEREDLFAFLAERGYEAEAFTAAGTESEENGAESAGEDENSADSGQPEGEGTDKTTEEIGKEDRLVKAEIAVPMKNHSAETLRNLVNLLYQRQILLDKATGGTFRMDEKLTVELLKTGKCGTVEEFLRTVSQETGLYDGISFDGEQITFTGFPATDSPETIQAFTQLASLMNRQALTQRRIQPKHVDEENEKYAMRIWLLRIGMKGAEFKETRRILLEKLSGNSAFRTEGQRLAALRKEKQRREQDRPAEETTKGASAEETDSSEEIVEEAPAGENEVAVNE